MLGKVIDMRNDLIHQFKQNYLKSKIVTKDIVIDATLGNGHDTFFLQSLGAIVHGFDIQEKAIFETKNRLDDLMNIHLHHESFTHLLDYNLSFKGVIFNLGYLPNGDKTITTLAKDTLDIVRRIINQMTPGQFIFITCYPGHSEGMKESELLLSLIKTLPNDYLAFTYQIQNRTNAPFNIVIEK